MDYTLPKHEAPVEPFASSLPRMSHAQVTEAQTLLRDIDGQMGQSLYDLGGFGVNKDGVDGIRGGKNSFTTKAIELYEAKHNLVNASAEDIIKGHAGDQAHA